MPVQSSDPPRLVRVGIDAAVVAQHEVCLRVTGADGRIRVDRFHVPPTLAGLRSLTGRLSVDAGCGGGGGADIDDVARLVGGVT